MGFHKCEYCESAREGRGQPETRPNNRFSNVSSGDVTLKFANGHSYQMPDMILHYVADHTWAPPRSFVLDVFRANLVSYERDQTRGEEAAEVPMTRIGYLQGGDLARSQGPVPPGFIEKLQEHLRQASNQGDREQTRSLKRKPRHS